jgi:short subunit fatty acids transporter
MLIEWIKTSLRIIGVIMIICLLFGPILCCIINLFTALSVPSGGDEWAISDRREAIVQAIIPLIGFVAFSTTVIVAAKMGKRTMLAEIKGKASGNPGTQRTSR